MRVKTIFTSADGEANGWMGPGEITTFIRLQGCTLGCKYCDTFQAQDPDGGTKMGIGELYDRVMLEHPQKLTITGGEPLEQAKDVEHFIKLLHGINPYMRITLETNGVEPLPPYILGNQKVAIVMDYKPDSMCNLTGNQQATRKKNKDLLLKKDLLKFIICTRSDYESAVSIVKGHYNDSQIAFSPLHGVLDPQVLVEWMFEDNIPGVRLSVQLHKYIWPHCIDTEEER